MGTLGAVRFSTSTTLFEDVPPISATAVATRHPRPTTTLCRLTLSECLFFFGIYAFHPVELEGSAFQFLEAATPSFPTLQPKQQQSTLAFRRRSRKLIMSRSRRPPRPGAPPCWHAGQLLRAAPRNPPPVSFAAAPECGAATLTVAYGHTTGNTPEPVRFQKLSPVRPS